MIKSLYKSQIRATERWLYRNNLKSTQGLTLPSFIGLGPRQSGSTWLYENLSEHPEIFIPPTKELNYFDRNLHRFSLKWYAAHFQSAGGQVSGEISPGYCILREDRLQFFRKVLPEVRLILTIRNPIERSWSAARRLMARFNFKLEELEDSELEKYFRMEWAYRLKSGERMPGDYEPGLLEGSYSKIIKHWLAHYPEEQLLVVFFKQMIDDPMAYLSTVCEHIGVSKEFKWDPNRIFRKVNANPETQIPPRCQTLLEELYHPEISWLRKNFGQQSI